MPVKRNKRLAVAQRRQRVSELYLEGWSQPAIARELGVAQSTINKDLQAIEKEWSHSAIRDTRLDREILHQKLNRLEQEAWVAYRRSQQPIESTRVVQTSAERRAEKRVTQHHGDRRYLDFIVRIADDRRVLLGLDAAPTPDGNESQLGFSWEGIISLYDPRPVPDPIAQIIENLRNGRAEDVADTDCQHDPDSDQESAVNGDDG